MDERLRPFRRQTIPLSLAAGRRIVMPDGEPVLGWLGSETGRVAEPLTFPAHLLEEKSAGSVFYAANLPRLPVKTKGVGSPAAAAKAARKIRLAQEAAFVAASLPGGQVPLNIPGGRSAVLRFRWLPLGPLSWRCYASLRGGSADEAWTPLPHIYAFDTSGFLERHPSAQNLSAGGRELQIVHPEGLLTCLPCTSSLTKVRHLETDGWGKRELTGLELLPDLTLAAQFSDRRTLVFATAAPAQAAPALAA